MSQSELGELMDIVGDLKDEIYALKERLQATREHVALLTEALDESAPIAITSTTTTGWQPNRQQPTAPPGDE